ncbi:MAG TPA: winged helix-turn-helix domain-containing protein [Dehalococcoidia bacterium]|nr:winged helix-turn-helix domain-containing protein [Dehalococcoidia bacterium]
MTTETRPSPTDVKEWRRLRAWELHQQGWTGRAIAAALGVTPGAVSQWLRRARERGVAALRRRPPPGAVPKLTAAQRAALPEVLVRGAEAHGFVGDVWTTKRVATVIRREFGVSYHPAHVSRLLRAIHWSLQRPIRRASQRREVAVATWEEERRPALEAKPRKRGARSLR